MPLTTKSEDKTLPSDYNQLLNTLKNEWNNPKESGLPIIIEDQSLRTKSVRLYVIWDRFSEVPRDVRSQLIAEAYKDIHRDASEQITLIIGYDVEEAVNVGLLPYKIECRLKSSEKETYEKCRQALLQFGAWQRRGQLELRFADEKNARKVYSNLQQQCQGPFWAFVIEINVEDRLNFEQSVSGSLITQP
jgi:hypothetical protein